MTKPKFQYIHESHLDLFWIGDYRYCLERGRHVIKDYIDRCLEYKDETFMLETVVFLEYFLGKHPEYREAVINLWKEGRLDIGAAYIDILEHHVFGEGQIRNIVKGKEWCRKNLGIDTKVASHTDLPSLIPQIAQIYGKADVPYYSTSRKIFPDGAVWLHKAPDGSRLMMFNHPNHYDFHELKYDAEDFNEGRGWFSYIDPNEIIKGFPLGKLILSAGASDQTDLQCFRERYGKSAREFVEDYKIAFPELDISFGSITAMMEEYKEIEEQLPELEGEIPSVWGISSVESGFFKKAARLEGLILTAEILETVEKWYGIHTAAAARGEWNGTLYERLFFLGKDPIPYGKELDELWKMHLFVFDHNFGGNHAAQTSFDKRTIQERAITYGEELISHGLGQFAGAQLGSDRVLVFNPLNWKRKEPVTVEIPREAAGEGLCIRDSEGNRIPWQYAGSSEEADSVPIFIIPEVQGVGYRFYDICSEDGERQQVEALAYDNGCEVVVDTKNIRLEVDKKTGAIKCLTDKKRNADWGGDNVNMLYAAYEKSFDVPLVVDESKPMGIEELVSVELAAVGPLFVTVKVVKTILRAYATQEITVWQDGLDMVDIKTSILWHGQKRVQLRQCMPSAEKKDDVYYGTPFYGSNWNNLVPGSGPRNPDEMYKHDWYDYRETQLWIHQKRGDSALSISTIHSTYHWGKNGLEAVFLRNTPSCSDDRYFKENCGLLEFGFRFSFTGADAGLAVPARMGCQELMPLSAKLLKGRGMDAFPAGESFILLSENVILSAVFPGENENTLFVRFFEANGRNEKVNIRIPCAERLERVSLLGEVIGEIPGSEEGWTIEIKPYEILTVKASKK